jgi:hypothetical protein
MLKDKIKNKFQENDKKNSNKKNKNQIGYKN